MNLSPEQKQIVAGWVAAGDNLSAVQKKLGEHFKITMTYMDVRFLVDDLGLELKNAAPKAESDLSKAPAPKPAAATPPPRSAAPSGQAGPGDDEDEALAPGEDYPEEGVPANPAPAGASTLTLDVDRIVRPGAVVSGSVTFSDGVSGKWALDQYGRLMLDTPQKGYQPSAADVQTFQRELQAQLQRSGF